jgi:hypothetical protein
MTAIPKDVADLLSILVAAGFPADSLDRALTDAIQHVEAEFPHHMKIAAAMPHAETIAAFVSWLKDDDTGLVLCRRDASGALVPDDTSVQHVVLGFLGIPADEFDDERKRLGDKPVNKGGATS